MWIVPRPLDGSSEEQIGGRKFFYFGYEFESPWTEVVNERKFKSLVTLNFSNGASITIYDPATGANELQVMKDEASKRGRTIESVFGEEATRSRYALRSKILNLTPKDLNLFSSRQEMVGNSVLLVLKGAELSRIKGGLYSFQTKWTRGFQEGSPDRDSAVVIDAFDSQDNKIELLIGVAPGGNRLSQAEINRILFTLRPLTPSLPN
ncbi:MAG: hypothetical protein WAN12_19780 [Candidatus Acidiferrum sp.]